LYIPIATPHDLLEWCPAKASEQLLQLCIRRDGVLKEGQGTGLVGFVFERQPPVEEAERHRALL